MSYICPYSGILPKQYLLFNFLIVLYECATLTGAAVFFVMTALGDMAAFLLMNKSFAGYATRMVDPAFG